MIQYLYIVAVVYGEEPQLSAVHFRHRRIEANSRVEAIDKGRKWAEKTKDIANRERIENHHLVRLGFA